MAKSTSRGTAALMASVLALGGGRDLMGSQALEGLDKKAPFSPEEIIEIRSIHDRKAKKKRVAELRAKYISQGWKPW